jgi:hypothetical protein
MGNLAQALFCKPETEPSSRGLTHFMAAALPEIPTYALKLGDKTSATSVPRGHSAGCTRVRSFRVRGLGFID